MKKIFAETLNVKKFLFLTNKLMKNTEDIPSMGLIFSDPGLGKTKTAIWYATREKEAIYCRCVNHMSQRWLLEKIVAEAGEIPTYRTPNLFNQIIEQLLTRPRLIFIDEVDYLCASGAVEILRDIHDITHAPIVLIGMGMSDKKLMRYRHLYDRLSEIVKFLPLTNQDVQTVITQMCEVKISGEAIDHITKQTQGKFRDLIKYMRQAEYIAKTNNVKELTTRDLQR